MPWTRYVDVFQKLIKIKIKIKVLKKCGLKINFKYNVVFFV